MVQISFFFLTESAGESPTYIFFFFSLNKRMIYTACTKKGGKGGRKIQGLQAQKEKDNQIE